MIIQPINPIYFYKGVPDYYYYDLNPFDCYSQKFERTDETRLQILSEEENVTVSLIRKDNNQLVNQFSASKIGTVKDTDLSIFQADLSFDFLEGLHYFKVSDGQDELFSELISIKKEHKKTIWIEYANSTDHEGFKFNQEDGLVGFRVEGTVQEFQPDSDDNIYSDANVRAETLKSTPFRTFNLYIGNKQGVPDYILDIVNRIFTCDNTFINGRKFNKTEDSDWEVDRLEEFPYSAMQIRLQAIDPIMKMAFENIGSDEPEGGCVLYRKAKRFETNDDLRIAGILKNRTVLDYIEIYGASPYDLKIGTSANGNQIGEVSLTDSSERIDIGLGFNSSQDLYLSGLQNNQTIFVVYERLDKELCVSGDGQNIDVSNFIPKMTIMYDGTPTEFINDFDQTTGLGRGDYEGWAICDGRNGTVDRRDSFPMGWKDSLMIGATGGNNQMKLEEKHLPKISPKWRWNRGERQYSKGGGDSIAYNDQTQNPGRQEQIMPVERNVIEPFGGDTPFDNRPKYMVTVFIQKI